MTPPDHDGVASHDGGTTPTVDRSEKPVYGKEHALVDRWLLAALLTGQRPSLAEQHAMQRWAEQSHRAPDVPRFGRRGPRLPGPELPQSTVGLGPLVDHDQWRQQDPRRRHDGEIDMAVSDLVDPAFRITYQRCTQELVLHHCRLRHVEVLGVLADEAAHRTLREWHNRCDPQRVGAQFRPGNIDQLRTLVAEHAEHIAPEREADVALARHADQRATEHGFQLGFARGIHKPLEFYITRPVATGGRGIVASRFIRPVSPAEIDAAFTDFIVNSSPDKVENDPASGWREAAHDDRAAAREVARLDAAGRWPGHAPRMRSGGRTP